MDRQNWTYVSGLVSAQWDRFMGRREILAVLGAGSAEDRRTQLRASVLFPDVPLPGNLAEQVEDAFCSCVRGVAALAPDDRIADLFLLEHDWETFRAGAKLQVRGGGRSAQARPADAPDASRFDSCWRGNVEDERLMPFAEAARRITSGCPTEGDKAGWIDGLVDACEAASLMRAATGLGSDDLLDWIRTWANLRAGLSLIRARRMGWEAEPLLGHWQEAGFDDPALADLATGAESAWPSAMDRLGLPVAGGVLAAQDATTRLATAIDNRLGQLASAALGIPFGPERVFAFLWAARAEALNLKLALSAAEFGIPEQRITAEWQEGYG